MQNPHGRVTEFRSDTRKSVLSFDAQSRSFVLRAGIRTTDLFGVDRFQDCDSLILGVSAAPKGTRNQSKIHV